MFKSKTLFILGAGASVDFGLPTGDQLKPRIARAIDIRYRNGSELISGNFKIVDAIKRLAREKNPKLNGNINPYLAKAWTIRDALPQAISIDNFIDAHSHDEMISDIGKLAIALCILEAEHNSMLFVDRTKTDRLDFARLEATWIASFFKVLTADVRKADVERAIENVSIISFNYDRCIEHYLRYAFQNYYKLEDQVAEALVQKLLVLHPYGQVGRLPWQEGGGIVDFGQTDEYDPSSLLTGLRNLRVFTEQQNEPSAVTPMRLLVQEAETIIFLGFAFHPLNLELIAPQAKSRAKRVFATAYGMSEHDIATVRLDISTWLQADLDALNVVAFNGKCSKLFEDFSRSLPRNVP